MTKQSEVEVAKDIGFISPIYLHFVLRREEEISSRKGKE
jgi:hypothetical protein